ncbi:MAG: 30S ribosome-binding factor RbfA [candidate division Zixibacteria bacterium]|nr:30S ribosome-binding factor RbfA [candidate division Zixibacteria bacterium]
MTDARQFRRSDRLSGQILRDISSLMDTDYRDRAPAMITITHVRLSKDLHYATVYYSVLGSEETRRSATEFLERECKRIRRLVGSNLHIRRVPELTFKFDPSIEEGIKIERLLNEIKNDTEQ